jgi:hypothetical protein
VDELYEVPEVQTIVTVASHLSVEPFSELPEGQVEDTSQYPDVEL